MKIEIRSATEAVIKGYVNAVGRDSRFLPSPEGKYVEQITPKTFENAISKASDIELRFNHQKHLGSTKEGNLTLYEDNIGLYATATITDAETIQKAKNNELRGWSFGFV
ncbi:MAG: HK97 family phage prohead protease, partial [Oscillospiraceae bacterium]